MPWKNKVRETIWGFCAQFLVLRCKVLYEKAAQRLLGEMGCLPLTAGKKSETSDCWAEQNYANVWMTDKIDSLPASRRVCWHLNFNLAKFIRISDLYNCRIINVLSHWIWNNCYSNNRKQRITNIAHALYNSLYSEHPNSELPGDAFVSFRSPQWWSVLQSSLTCCSIRQKLFDHSPSTHSRVVYWIYGASHPCRLLSWEVSSKLFEPGYFLIKPCYLQAPRNCSALHKPGTERLPELQWCTLAFPRGNSRCHMKMRNRVDKRNVKAGSSLRLTKSMLSFPEKLCSYVG